MKSILIANIADLVIQTIRHEKSPTAAETLADMIVKINKGEYDCDDIRRKFQPADRDLNGKTWLLHRFLVPKLKYLLMMLPWTSTARTGWRFLGL